MQLQVLFSGDFIDRRVIGAIAIIRWMFITLEDFGSVRKKTQRKLRKKEALERYLKFLDKDYDRATYLKRVGGFLIPIKNIGS